MLFIVILFSALIFKVTAQPADPIKQVREIAFAEHITLVNGTEFLEIPSKHLSAGEYNLQIKNTSGFKFVKKLLK